MRSPLMTLPAAVLASLAACASRPAAPPEVPATQRAPEVPAALRAPEGETLFLEARASGVQIYECTQKPDGAYDWVLKAPEATLSSADGKSLGKHYGGPTWAASDGSTVVGVVKERDPGPTPSAIPWLLLGAKTTSGSGTFGPTKSIQRLSTVGGVAPHDPCGTTQLGQIVRVPYTASYYFYR